MLKLIPSDSSNRKAHLLTLDEVAREGACRMLIKALEAEVTDYIDNYSDLVDTQGNRLVVRNGKAKARSVTVGSGTFKVEVPRINDRRDDCKFRSSMLPPYLRRSANVDSLLPILYLKGLSTNDFAEALKQILGAGVTGLSASSIVSLKKSWDQEFEEWRKRPIKGEFVYIWADGVNVKIRLGEDKKLCLLVIIGARADGSKELLAVDAGWRESKESWKGVLNDLVARGLKAPLLAVGDGALGFWGALRACPEFKNTREQRCWVHQIVNVLDCFPKRLRPRVKSFLHEIMYSDTKADAVAAKNAFANEFNAKYEKGVNKLEKDWEELTAYYSFPAHHWKHLRTTNVIESLFATVKLRTKVTKGAGSVTTAKTMAFKLMREAEKRWKKLHAPAACQDLLNGVEFKDGVVVANKRHQEAMPA